MCMHTNKIYFFMHKTINRMIHKKLFNRRKDAKKIIFVKIVITKKYFKRFTPFNYPRNWKEQLLSDIILNCNLKIVLVKIVI